jgi:hypothetical protein
VASAGEDRIIPAEELRRIQDVALEWAAYNHCPHPRSVGVLLTTTDAAIKVLQGPEVRAYPDDETYLVVVEGDMVLQDALDGGAPRAPTGEWAALFIKPSQNRVGSLTLRPAEAAVDISSLGRVYTLVG